MHWHLFYATDQCLDLSDPLHVVDNADGQVKSYGLGCNYCMISLKTVDDGFEVHKTRHEDGSDMKI